MINTDFKTGIKIQYKIVKRNSCSLLFIKLFINSLYIYYNLFIIYIILLYYIYIIIYCNLFIIFIIY